jgi:methyl-accepting chemotaxis protein
LSLSGTIEGAEGDFDLHERRDQRAVFLHAAHGSVIAVGCSIEPESRQLAWQLAGIGSAVTLIGIMGGFLLSRNAVQPLATMSATAAAISASDLSRRIDTANFDRELQSLATTLNDTFDRLPLSVIVALRPMPRTSCAHR